MSSVQVPCTPAGCVELLQRSGVTVAGKTATVLGRWDFEGRDFNERQQFGACRKYQETLT